MTIRHEVTQEFGIPRAQLLKPINGELLEIIGRYAPDVRSVAPAELLLSLVLLEGYSYGGQSSWGMVARSAHAGDEAEPIFGSALVRDDADARITSEEALQAGAEWIRSSQTVEFMPGPVLPLTVPEDMKTSGVAGLLLVRAVEAQE
jgi:hypothetical protein